MHFGDILDPFFILNLLKSHQIDEIYHFAAQSHVGASFALQLYTCDVNSLGTLRILQAITTLDLQKHIKFYNVRCGKGTKREENKIRELKGPPN